MTSKRYLGLGGAVMLAVAAWTHPALAQFPAQGQDGHATDANNRVGSGGYNGGGPRGPAVTGNQIVTGNVTGGRQFRGPIGYSDPSSFSGPMGGGSVDRFVKGSSGAPDSSGGPNNLSNTVMAYYGDRRAVPPPSGSLPVGFNGGYVGSASSLNSSMNPAYSTASSAVGGLQSRTVDRDELELTAQLNPAAYGALSAQSNPDVNSLSSPLWGGRLPGLNGQLGTTNVDLNAQNAMSDRYRVADPALLQMQRELREAAGLQTPADSQKDNGSSLNPNDSNTPGKGQNNPTMQSGVRNLNNPIQTPETPPLGGQAMASSLMPDPLNSTLKTYESNRNYLTNPPPALQSQQLDELQRRLKQYTDQAPPTDADANRIFLMERRRAEELAARKGAPTVVTAPQPGAITPPLNAQQPVALQPLPMHHLYDGIKAKGLHDLMEKAEGQMHDGKFATAIETYNRANQVAPNNSLTLLGRSIAELGAGFYSEADRDLRVTYRSAPELLWGQIDLKSMFPADRLAFLQTDLDRLTIDQPKESRPWFLKAFIAYNTGETTASVRKNLDEAESRSGKLDWTIRLLRQHWAPGASKAPTTRPASGLNK